MSKKFHQKRTKFPDISVVNISGSVACTLFESLSRP